MREYEFDCPICGERYWRDESIVYDKEYGESVCFRCKEELVAERHSEVIDES